MKKHWKILLVLLVAAVLLTGCKAKAPQEAQEACESFFAAFTSQDEAALAAVLEGGELSMPASGMQQLMEEKLAFFHKGVQKGRGHRHHFRRHHGGGSGAGAAVPA